MTCAISSSLLFLGIENSIGTHFTGRPFTITIPPTPNDSTSEFLIPENFVVIDDDKSEVQQSFALVAQLGVDVPGDLACFQRWASNTECFGRSSATEISG